LGANLHHLALLADGLIYYEKQHWILIPHQDTAAPETRPPPQRAATGP